jgi:hypothetical protein
MLCRHLIFALLRYIYSLTTSCFSSNATFGTEQQSYKKLVAGGTHDLMLAEEGDIQMGILGGNRSTKPSWVDDVDAVEDVLRHIQQQMKDLQSMHAQRVGSVFGKDLEDMEHLIERRTADITDQFRYAERLLQKVGVATRRSGGQEATVGANVQRRYEE